MFLTPVKSHFHRIISPFVEGHKPATCSFTDTNNYFSTEISVILISNDHLAYSLIWKNRVTTGLNERCQPLEWFATWFYTCSEMVLFSHIGAQQMFTSIPSNQLQLQLLFYCFISFHMRHSQNTFINMFNINTKNDISFSIMLIRPFSVHIHKVWVMMKFYTNIETSTLTG